MWLQHFLRLRFSDQEKQRRIYVGRCVCVEYIILTSDIKSCRYRATGKAIPNIQRSNDEMTKSNMTSDIVLRVNREIDINTRI